MDNTEWYNGFLAFMKAKQGMQIDTYNSEDEKKLKCLIRFANPSWPSIFELLDLIFTDDNIYLTPIDITHLMDNCDTIILVKYLKPRTLENIAWCKLETSKIIKKRIFFPDSITVKNPRIYRIDTYGNEVVRTDKHRIGQVITPWAFEKYCSEHTKRSRHILHNFDECYNNVSEEEKCKGIFYDRLKTMGKITKEEYEEYLRPSILGLLFNYQWVSDKMDIFGDDIKSGNKEKTTMSYFLWSEYIDKDTKRNYHIYNVSEFIRWISGCGHGYCMNLRMDKVLSSNDSCYEDLDQDRLPSYEKPYPKNLLDEKYYITPSN